jgi:hypothetical protein
MSAGPQLLCPASAVAPPQMLTDIIDTFTASNGTDPTTRDIDANGGVAGFTRWMQAYAVNGDSEIQANALSSIVGNVGRIELHDGEAIYSLPLPWMILVDGMTVASGTNGNNAFFVQTLGTDGEITLEFDRHSSGGTDLDFYYKIDNGTTLFDNFAENGGYGHLITGLGPHKIGLFVEASGVSVILNGTVLGTSTDGDGVYADLRDFQVEVDGNDTASTTLNRIAVLTTVADLTAAIALTA